jgi:hypothetical protein
MNTLEWKQDGCVATAEANDRAAYVVCVECWHVWTGPRGGKHWTPLFDIGGEYKTIEEAKLRVEEHYAKYVKQRGQARERPEARGREIRA